MSSSLPYDEAVTKIVEQFGLGPYDSDNDGPFGEDSDRRDHGKSLPDGGGSVTPDGPDTMQSYPTTPSAFAMVAFDGDYASWLHQKRHELTSTTGGINLYPYGSTPEYMELRRQIRGGAELPGDFDVPPVGRKKVQDTINDTVPSVSQTGLPNDGGNPSARSDYYDRMRQGLERAPDPRSSDLWADEDSGAYAGEKKSLPTPSKNDVESDNSLQAIGNAWSGRTVEDSSNAEGFPSEDFAENVDFDRSDLDGGGKIMASGTQSRVSTDIGLVSSLTDALLKKFGKKDLTRRHVLALLKEVGKSQYLASDIIRCLKLSHKVYVKDVTDEFPVSKMASNKPSRIAAVRDNLVDLEILHMANPSTASEIRRCAASLSQVVAIVDRIWPNPAPEHEGNH